MEARCDGFSVACSRRLFARASERYQERCDARCRTDSVGVRTQRPHPVSRKWLSGRRISLPRLSLRHRLSAASEGLSVGVAAQDRRSQGVPGHIGRVHRRLPRLCRDRRPAGRARLRRELSAYERDKLASSDAAGGPSSALPKFLLVFGPVAYPWLEPSSSRFVSCGTEKLSNATGCKER